MTKRVAGDDDVRRRVGHLESEVGDLKEGLARLEVGMSGTQSDLDLIIKKLNQPAPKKDTWGMVTALAGCLVLISSFAWITLQPVKDDIVNLKNYTKGQIALQIAAADREGYSRRGQEDTRNFTLSLSTSYKELRSDIVKIREKQSAAKVYREAVDAYSKETRSIIDYTLTKD